MTLLMKIFFGNVIASDKLGLWRGNLRRTVSRTARLLVFLEHKSLQTAFFRHYRVQLCEAVLVSSVSVDP